MSGSRPNVDDSAPFSFSSCPCNVPRCPIPPFIQRTRRGPRSTDAFAMCGWQVQSKADLNLGAALGVAIREFPTASGPVDYALFVGRKLCGVVEAKPEGVTLSGFSEQAARYIADLPRHLIRDEGQVRFEYVASATETLFRDHADPEPRLAPPLRFPSTGDVGALAEGAGHPARPAAIHARRRYGRPPRLPDRRRGGARNTPWPRTIRARSCKWRPARARPSPPAR